VTLQRGDGNGGHGRGGKKERLAAKSFAVTTRRLREMPEDVRKGM